eukprot:Transcript_6774.p2 GENE.Transcript_6774~~Transcript_6774.p2  ORF type:complete len:348 (-),score=124.65 Transcript_6774:339-1382(-)
MTCIAPSVRICSALKACFLMYLRPSSPRHAACSAAAFSSSSPVERRASTSWRFSYLTCAARERVASVRAAQVKYENRQLVLARLSTGDEDEKAAALQAACRGLLGRKYIKKQAFKAEQMRTEGAMQVISKQWQKGAATRQKRQMERARKTLHENEDYFGKMKEKVELEAIEQIQRWWRGARVRRANYVRRMAGQIAAAWRKHARREAHKRTKGGKRRANTTRYHRGSRITHALDDLRAAHTSRDSPRKHSHGSHKHESHRERERRSSGHSNDDTHSHASRDNHHHGSSFDSKHGSTSSFSPARPPSAGRRGSSGLNGGELSIIMPAAGPPSAEPNTGRRMSNRARSL